MLLRTPAQLPGESFAGFLLRVSEANGYRFPRRLAQLAGIDNRSLFTAKADILALANVLGRGVESLRPYSGAGTDGTLNVKLNGHSILSGALRPWYPGLCVHCVAEFGFIPAWSDLAIVDACPFHERVFLFKCESCQLHLSWERWGLLRCKCDAELNGEKLARIEPEHRLLLMDVVDAVAFDWRSTWTPRCEALAGCRSLAGVIATIRALAKLHVAATADSARISVLRRAARLAIAWPLNLHSALSALGPRVGNDGGFEHLSRHRHGVLREFIRHLPAEELAHMRVAMASFELRSHESLALQSVEQDEEPPKAAPTKPRKPRVVAPDNSGTLGYWEAGRVASLPQSVMRFLRQTGLLTVRHATRYMATFNRADVEDLVSRIQSLPVAKGNGDAISLRDAMRLKLFHADGKGELVAAVLEQRIRVRSQAPGVGVKLDRADVDAFCAEARRRTFGGAITPTEGAAALYCSNAAVVSLFAAGHIAGQRIGVRNVRLDPDSLARFSELYRSVASVAVELKTSSQRLLSLADRGGVSILAVPGNKGILQGFVARRDIDQLCDLARQTPLGPVRRLRNS